MVLRIVSLLPAATEMVYALGLGKHLVGVSDDSDFPEVVRSLPKVVTTSLPAGLSSGEIDRRVREAKHRGIGIFHVDQKLLGKLSPTLILSQELCEVCAIGTAEIRKAAWVLNHPVRTISLEPDSISDILENIRMIGSLTGKEKEAEVLVRNLEKRVERVRHIVTARPQSGEAVSMSEIASASPRNDKPRVLIMEWLDPIMVAGHWVPEMIEKAGGVSLLCRPGDFSKRITWQEVLNADPDILIIAPCGFDIDQAKKEIKSITSKKGYGSLKAVRSKQVYYIDGNAYLTRPGPRIVDGIEILAEIFYPKIFTRKHSEKDWTVWNS